MAAYTNTTYDLVARSLVLGGERVTDRTSDVAVSYALTHNGADYGGGTMTYGAHDREGAWSARFFLPSAPGVLKAVVTATATINGESLIGQLQATIQVI